MEVFLAQTIDLFVSDAPRVLFILFLFCVLGVLEWLLPAQAGQSIRGRARNLGLMIILLLLGTTAVSLLLFFIDRRFSTLPFFIPVIVIALICSLFLSDLIYWYHRAQHMFPWLWTIHELHHSDTELNATTALRTYWLEYPIQIAIIATPVHLLIGVNPLLTFVYMLAAAFLLVVSHANLKLHLGVFTPVIVGPQLHRIHHSRLTQHQDKNFAQYFPVIDKVFGTYYAPAREEFPPTGSPHLATDAPVLIVLSRPFHEWRRRLY